MWIEDEKGDIWNSDRIWNITKENVGGSLPFRITIRTLDGCGWHYLYTFEHREVRDEKFLEIKNALN